MNVFQKSIFIITIFLLIISNNSYSKENELNSDEKEEIISKVTSLLKTHYIKPNTAKKSIIFIKKKLNSKSYDGINNLTHFIKVLSKDLKVASQDNRLDIVINVNNKKITNSEISEREQIIRRFKEKADNYGFKNVEILDGNIGYLKFDYFSGHVLAIKTLDSSLFFLSNSNALIIDLRENLGGSSEMLNYMISYFLKSDISISMRTNKTGKLIGESKTSHIDKRYKFDQIPLFILTSANTSSKAEAFSYYLQSNERAKIVGERTKGIANIGGFYAIDNKIKLFIPTVRVVSPITKSNWERAGVMPDFKAPIESTFKEAYTIAIEAAEKFKNQSIKQKILEIEKVKNILSEAQTLFPKNSKLAKAKVNDVLERLVLDGVLDETEINDMGYRYLWSKKSPLKARLIFEFNKNKYPNSYNVYGSLADSYVELGLIELAIKNYNFALTLEPNDNYSKKQLEKIKKIK